MGVYINPIDCTKEDWLKKNAEHIGDPRSITPTFTKDSGIPICLVDNGIFTAAGVCYDESEFKAFQEPNDPREKLWFIAPAAKIAEVAPELMRYLDNN